MRKAAILLVLLALSCSQYYETHCGACGNSTIPKKCSELLVSQPDCSIPSYSFMCQKEETREGWIFCPSCPEGYSLASCGSSWLFGLYKTSHCTMTYPASCGTYCDRQDNVLLSTECAIAKKKMCCEIPTNRVEIVSPSGNNISFYRNDSVNFTIQYFGTVKNVSLDFGDGKSESQLAGTGSFLFFAHTYTASGDITARATAFSCLNCSHIYNSTSSVSIAIKYRR